MSRMTTTDRFATDLTAMISDMAEGVERRLPKAVRKSTKAGRDTAREHAPVRDASHESPEARAKRPEPGSYAESLVYTVSRKKDEVKGEVGSRQYPGLVHLLEKGHATLGGGFVAARPHIIYGKEKADRTLVEELGKAVEEAMEAI